MPAHDAKSHFIHEVADAVYSGYGLNPLIGSGVSAASGIIMGIEFANYLAYVVQKVLDEPHAWDLRRNGWPAFPRSEDYNQTREWTREQFLKMCERERYHVGLDASGIYSVRPIDVEVNSQYSFTKALNCPPVPANIRSYRFQPFDSSIEQMATAFRERKKRADPYEPLWAGAAQSSTSRRWILELGLRSLGDWRATLRFLSRVRKTQNGRIVLSRADQTVIDRFNTFITADRQPNLAHKMIAALARPLRMRTILTTNFDTLLEDAFVQSGQVLTKFNVSLKGRLPDPFVVRAQPSIIKLHGELLETRADHSLDFEPTSADKQRFLRYFVDVYRDSERFQSMLSHLLVLGSSLSDIRIVRMIQFMLDETAHFDPKNRPKVFCLCVSDSSVKRVEALFAEYPGRLITCQTNRPDLLLLELYQRLTRALPGAGQTYEYNHNVPPSRTGRAPFEQSLSLGIDQVRVEAQGTFSHSRYGTVEARKCARDALARLAGHTLYERFNGRTPTILQPDVIDNYFTIQDLSAIRSNGELAGIEGDASKPGVPVWKFVLQETRGNDHRVLFFTTACGALESLGILHAKLSRSTGRHCLWFELADYVDNNSLLRDILRSIALRSGRFQREHVMLHPLSRPINWNRGDENEREQAKKLADHLKQLCRVQRLTPRDLPILLYGRDPAGSCANWEGNPWDEAIWGEFPILIAALATAGFPVVLAHSCQKRLDGELDKLEKAVDYAKQQLAPDTDSTKQVGSIAGDAENREHKTFLGEKDAPQDANAAQPDDDSRKTPYLPPFLTASAVRDDQLSVFSQAFQEIFDRCLNDVEYRRFIYASSLFRQSRRPSALFYEAVQPCPARFQLHGVDNDVNRAEKANEWVQHLEELRVFYGKAGGSSWMHRDIREALRKSLDTVPYLDRGEARLHCHEVARAHFWIGDWYDKAFYATGFPKPVWESVYHRYQAARTARFAIPRGMSLEHHSDEIKMHRYLLLRSSLNAIAKTVMMARPYLKLWLANPHGFPMFAASERFKNLVKETASDCGFDDNQRRELEKCCSVLDEVFQETHNSITNEVDLQISAQLPALQSSNSGLSTASLREALHELWNANYAPSDVWGQAIRNLIEAIGTSYSIDKEALEACFPFGAQTPTNWEADYARQKGRAISALGPEFEKLPELLVAIEALAYLQLRRAKFVGHGGGNRSESGAAAENLADAWRRKDVRLEWLRITRLCNLGVDWCKHLPASVLRLDAELRIRLHSYYAVALANLDRFYEAHRHLNEAAGIRSKHESATPRVEQAKLKLRRAEVILTEAHRIAHVIQVAAKWPEENIQEAFKERFKRLGLTFSDMPPSGGVNGSDAYLAVRMHPSAEMCVRHPSGNLAAMAQLKHLLVATLDDAWFEIEGSERALSGQSQSALWWGRIALMKLRACGYQAQLWGESDRNAGLRMLAYRHRRINPQAMWQVYENASLNNGDSLYRKLRLMRYAASCLQAFARSSDEIKFIDDCHKQLASELTQLKKTRSQIPAEFSQVFKTAEQAIDQAGAAIGIAKAEW